MYKTLKSPIHVNLEVTSRCNNKCIHCYNYWRKDNDLISNISLNQMRKITNSLIENEILSVAITGGEPFLCADIVFDTIEHLQKAGIFCAVNSNLTILTPSIADKLHTLNVGILTSLLSFDKNTHDRIVNHCGAFEKTVENIKLLRQREVPICVNMVIMQENSDHVYKTGEFVHNLGVKNFTATRVEAAEGCDSFDSMKLSPNMLKSSLDDLLLLHNTYGLDVGNQTCYPACFILDLENYHDIRLKGCGAGVSHCTVGSNGEVRACTHTSDSYGNVFSESLQTIWNRMFKWRDGSYIPAQCKKCKYFYFCSGGCRAASKFFSAIDSLDPYAKHGAVEVRQKQLKKRIIDLDDTIYIPQLKFREELFGVILANNIHGNGYPVVTEDSAFIIKQLQGERKKLIEICKNFNLDQEKAGIFFGQLCEQRIVYKIK